MKKVIALMTAVMTGSVLCSSLNVSAADSDYSSTLYVKPIAAENVKVISEDTIQIEREVLENGDLSLNLGVYVMDEQQRIFALGAFWKCDSEYIRLEGLINPVTDDISDTPIEYTNSLGQKFSTTKLPFCYASIADDGSMVFDHKLDTAVEPDVSENAMALSYVNQQMSSTKPFTTLGATSDEYAFASFNAVFDSEIPDGVYDVYFLSRENPDPVRERYSNASIVSSSGIPESITDQLQLQSLNIVVGEYHGLGDVNFDGSVTAIDAAIALSAYAKNATGRDMELTGVQMLAADVNRNGKITAIDAAKILEFYAYKATTDNTSLTPEEYFGQNS